MPHLPLDEDARTEFPLVAADRCVKCGLCLPHCPTYRLTGSEAESPRGRIALLQGLAEGQLDLTDRGRDHLDHCLACRACERVCPADVPYGRIIDAGRRMTAPAEPAAHRRLGRLGRDGLLAHPRRLAGAMSLLRGAQRLHLPQLARRTGLARLTGLETALAELPALPRRQRWRDHYPAEGAEVGRVALFLGCIARHTDAHRLALTVGLLNRLGYAVDVPPGQNCCGALHAHAGETAMPQRLAAENAEAFAGADTVIHLATGCGAHLAEYPERYALFEGVEVVEASRFLADAEWAVEPDPLPGRVQVHQPCTARNVLRDGGAAAALLQRIPGLEVADLPGNDQCCGAAGTWFLENPEWAAQLRAPKVAAADADWLATTNPGCALHLAAGAPAAAVVHPVELAARAFGVAGISRRISP
ncbi:MAG: (Fe-S)-binding protein [Pseudomonadota bacterium]